MIVECDLETCPHCGRVLKARKPWHSRTHIQTLEGPLFVAGRSKACVNPVCPHAGAHYYASGVLLLSLPYSTYGLDVLAFIGWQHEHEHRQLIEIQRELNRRGIAINERNVGKLYRQFLALQAAADQKTLRQLAATAAEHGGLIWAVDGLQPEGCGSLLYVLYEVLGGTPVAATQLEHASAEQLRSWLAPYQQLPFAALATLSDAEEAIMAALKSNWPTAPHQRCQAHFLSNLVAPVLEVDAQLARRSKMISAVCPPCRNTKRQPPSPHQARRLLFVAGPRDGTLRALEQQIRWGVRDAVNRSSRKPFGWGGLCGYQQLEALAQELHVSLTGTHPSPYLQQVLVQLERALTHNRTLAGDVGAAFGWVRRIAACLRYGDVRAAPASAATAAQVRQEMETLLDEFQPDFKRQAAQTALQRTWGRLWRTWGPELLHCYEIPGLPADNLQLEAFFGRLRRHQRRISGRKSTAELRNFGHCQALFQAETEADLLRQLREVKLADYRAARQRLAEAEAARQFLHRLHRDPVKTVRQLLQDHADRQIELAQSTATSVHTT